MSNEKLLEDMEQPYKGRCVVAAAQVSWCIDLSMPIPYYTFSLTVYIHDRDWRDDTALMSM